MSAWPASRAGSNVTARRPTTSARIHDLLITTNAAGSSARPTPDTSTSSRAPPPLVPIADALLPPPSLPALPALPSTHALIAVLALTSLPAPRRPRLPQNSGNSTPAFVTSHPPLPIAIRSQIVYNVRVSLATIVDMLLAWLALLLFPLRSIARPLLPARTIDPPRRPPVSPSRRSRTLPAPLPTRLAAPPRLSTPTPLVPQTRQKCAPKKPKSFLEKLLLRARPPFRRPQTPLPGPRATAPPFIPTHQCALGPRSAGPAG